jgi:uncharacterized protein YvpB
MLQQKTIEHNMDNRSNELDREALLLAAKYRNDIKEGVTGKALKALKKKFGYDMPAHLYTTDAFGRVIAGQDERLIKLHAAVRDGQREVISYIARILDNDE